MPGHPRLGFEQEDVDARHKAGHDERYIGELTGSRSIPTNQE
jgi:hypothetical protein